MDSIVLAHVADAITYIRDVESDYSADVDYDAVADEAAGLLAAHPELAGWVESWDLGTIQWCDLVAKVRALRDANGAR